MCEAVFNKIIYVFSAKQISFPYISPVSTKEDAELIQYKFLLQFQYIEYIFTGMPQKIKNFFT